MKKYLVDPGVAEIINDFIRIVISHDLFPTVIGVSHDDTLCIPFKAVFRLNAIPCYEVLKLLNRRYNKVIIIINQEADVIIEVFDDMLPF